jgi:hypothetical protein
LAVAGLAWHKIKMKGIKTGPFPAEAGPTEKHRLHPLMQPTKA